MYDDYLKNNLTKEEILNNIKNNNISQINTEIWYDDYDIMHALVLYNESYIDDVSEALMSDAKFALSIIYEKPNLFTSFPQNIKEDLNIILLAISLNKHNYLCLDDDLQLDIRVLTVMLYDDYDKNHEKNDIFSHIDVYFRGDTIPIYDKFVKIIYDKVKNNKELLLNLININLTLIKYIVIDFYEENDIIDLIIDRYASKKILPYFTYSPICFTKENIIKILKKNANAIFILRRMYDNIKQKYIIDKGNIALINSILNDYDICFMVVNNSSWSILSIGEVWQNDIKLVEIALKKGHVINYNFDIIINVKHREYLKLIKLKSMLNYLRSGDCSDKRSYYHTIKEFLFIQCTNTWNLFTSSISFDKCIGFNEVNNNLNYLRDDTIIINFISFIVDTYYSYDFGAKINNIIRDHNINFHFI